MTKETKPWAGRLKALSFALLLALSSVCSLLISPLAKASSDYGIRTTTSTSLGGGDCPATDTTYIWSEYWSQDQSHSISYRNTWNYSYNYDNARATLDEAHDRFVSNLAAGAGYAVGTQDLGGGNHSTILYLFDPNANVTIRAGDAGTLDISGAPVWTNTMFYNAGSGCRYQDMTYNHNGNSSHTIQADQYTPLLFIASDHISYPSDYTGTHLSTTNNQNPKVFPEVEYTVENKKVTLRYKGNIGGCSITWGYQGEHDGDPLITHGQPSGDPFIFNADEYKKYTVIVDLKYFGPPAICEPFPDHVDVSILTFTLDVNGQDFSGDTGHMDCSTVGSHTSCLVPSPFEDCSTYGANLVGGFGCVIRNFGVALSILLKTLFVPNQQALTSRLNNLRDSFNAQMGFLLSPFTFLSGALQAIIDTPATTGCSVHLGNIFGHDSTVDPCNLASRIPALFSFIQIAVQAGVLLMVMGGLMSKYHEVLKA